MLKNIFKVHKTLEFTQTDSVCVYETNDFSSCFCKCKNASTNGTQTWATFPCIETLHVFDTLLYTCSFCCIFCICKPSRWRRVQLQALKQNNIQYIKSFVG